MNTFEQQVSDLMRNVAQAAPEVSVTKIVDGAIVMGQRRRRRHRYVRTGRVTAVAAIVAGIAVSGYHAVKPEVTHPRSRAPTLAAASTPIPAPNSVAAALRRILKRSGHVTNVQTSKASDGASVVTLQYDDGRGAAAVAVAVTPAPQRPFVAPTAGVGAWSCLPNATLRCRVRTLSDGSALLLKQNAAKGERYQQWTATLGRPDGVVITLNEWNSNTPKGLRTTRSEPPLWIDQLGAIAIQLDW